MEAKPEYVHREKISFLGTRGESWAAKREDEWHKAGDCLILYRHTRRLSAVAEGKQ
jgi:hypothetical protein